MGIAAAAFVYAVVTAVLFRNLLPDISTHLYAYLGDPLLNAAILGWNAARLPLTEEWWNFPSFAPLTGMTAFTEHLLLAYPVASPIVWLTGNPLLAYNIVFLLSFPLNGISAYALARELLGRHGGPRTRTAQPALACRGASRPDCGEGGTGSTWAAFIGGLAFAFAPYQAVQMTHVQMMMAFGIPLALLGLHRYIRGHRPWGLALFACGWLCAVLANAYTLVFVPLLVALWCAWFGSRAHWRRLAAVSAAAALVLLLMAPLLWGYYVRQSAYGLGRQYDEVKSFAADITGVAHIFHRSTFWRGILPETFEEGALFPGFTISVLTILALFTCGADLYGPRAGRAGVPRGSGPYPGPQGSAPHFAGDRLEPWSRGLLLTAGLLTLVVLARVWTGPFGWHIGPLPLPPFRPYRLFTLAAVLFVIGVVLARRFREAWSRRDPVLFYAVAALALWLVALGPEPEWSTPWRALIYGPFRLLMDIPGVQSIRVPARAWLPAALCLAMLAAFGAAALLGRYPRRGRVAIGVLALLIVAEGWFFEVAVAAPRPMRPGAIPAGAIVLDMPVEESFWNAIPQYRAVVGGYRTINGYSGYEPTHFNPLRHAIAEMRPDALDPYRRLADLYVIIRPGEDPAVVRWIVSHPGAQRLFDLGDATIVRLPRLAVR